MDAGYDPRSGHPRLAGPWGPQLAGYGSAPPDGGVDDVIVRVGSWILVGVAVAVVAISALAAAAAVYMVATWRRWRWWPLALTGVAGLLGVLAVSGPADAVDRHLLPVHELTTTDGRSRSVVADRWPAWLAGQLPLAVPIGVLLAALGRHQVTHVAAHELSPRARHRRDAEDRAALAAAIRRAATAPAHLKKDRPVLHPFRTGGSPGTATSSVGPGSPRPQRSDRRGVLGAWAAGDLDTWRAGPWCVVPDDALGLGTVLVGLPGAGKTETLLCLAQVALHGGWDVHVIDAKGDPATQDRFTALAASLGVPAKVFPAEAYDGFRGDPDALRNRLSRVVDYTEPYYQDGARVLLHAACTTPMGSLDELLGRLESAGDVDGAVRKGTLARYRSFAAAAGTLLSGAWAFEDTHASYLLLDGLALGDDTPRLARYLLEDFTHYATARKPLDRKVLLLVDEFSALRLGNAAALLERLRSYRVGVVVAAQSVEGLHDDPTERDRLLNAASTLMAHRVADPDPVVTRAGTIRRPERSHQLDTSGATGMGSLRMQDAYRIDPNDLRSLPTGVAYVVTGGRAAKVAVAVAQATRGTGSAVPRGETPPSSPPPEPDSHGQRPAEDDRPTGQDLPGAGNHHEPRNESPEIDRPAVCDATASDIPGSASPYARGL